MQQQAGLAPAAIAPVVLVDADPKELFLLEQPAEGWSSGLQRPNRLSHRRS